MNLNIRVNTSQKVEENIVFVNKKSEQQKARKSFFIGDTNFANDPIVQRRKEAQEKAWKVVSQAWESDKAVDKSVQSRKEHYTEMEKLREEETKKLFNTCKEEKTLQETYGVADDSEEQKDLKLLKKRQDILNKVTDDTLSKEEMSHLADIDQRGLTEYQQRALELNEQAGTFRKNIDRYDKQMRDDISDIKRITIERLKSDPMVDATKAAEDIKKAYNDEIIGMLVKESKDHIEEKMEEAEEAAEKKAEEKEEKEEKIEDIREMRALQEAVIEGTKEALERAEAEKRRNEAPNIEIMEMIELAQPDKQSNEVKQSLDEIKNSMIMLEADLKGIKVDEEV